MARNKIEVEVIGDSRSVERMFSRVGREAGKLENGLRRLGRASTLAIGTGIGVGIVGLGLALHSSTQELIQQQKAAAQTGAVIRSTGGIANVTAKHVDTLSNSLLKKTGIDDEVVQQGENMLLTFRNIRNEVGKGNDIFDQATRAGLDMSTAMKGAGFEGGSLQTTMIRLGKALNDPVTGMTALRRVGVTFTDAQKKTITRLEETHHHLAAQKLILRELRAEFGGSAQAYGKTLPGRLTILRESLKNVGAYLVGKFVPAFQAGIGVAERFGGFLSRIAHARNISVGLDIAGAGLKDLGGRVKNAIGRGIDSVDWKPIGMQLASSLGSAVVFGGNTLDKMLGSILGWVNSHATQIADIGATLAVKMVLTLTDPVFWAHHMDLLFGVILFAFGGAIGRGAGKLGGVLVKALGPTFERGAGELSLFFMRGVAKLPGVLGDSVALLTSAASRGMGRLVSEVARAPGLLAKVFRIGVLVTIVRVTVEGIKSAWNAFTDWITLKSLLIVRKIIEPFTHLPFGLGTWAQKMKVSINSQIDGIHANQFATKMENAAQRVANTAPKIAQAARAAATLSRALKSVPSDTTIRFIVKTLQMAPQTIQGRPASPGGHAAGGRIPGMRTMADSVPAMLSPGEFVVTGGGERMLESMTFPGVLNWLQRAQPRHFAGGGRATSTKTIEFDRLYQPPAFGGANTHGLVPQVLRALSFARGHGWHGSVTSGFRTYQQQAALYARYLGGGPLAARPGTSSHERGQAVDVTDYGKFGLTMAGAPPGSRLFNRLGGADPVHYSVSGYQHGGRVHGHHTAPRLPSSIREAEARAGGTPGLADDIAAYGRDLAWTNGQLARRDLTATERSSLRVHRIRVKNRLASLRRRQAAQRRRTSADINLPAPIRLAEAQARLTGTLDDDITAKGREVAYYQRELAKHPGRERRIALTNALADALDEYKSLLSERAHAGDDGGDTGGGGDNTADLQAQLDQARSQAAAANEANRLQAAFIGTGVFAGGGGGAGGGALGGGVHFNFLIPDAEQIRRATEAIASGVGGQPYRSSSVVRTDY